MPLEWTVPQAAVVPPTLTTQQVAGEDIRLRNGSADVGPHGDLATVRGTDAASQSVVREAGANPGSLVRRPEWGCGLPGQVLQGNTPSTRAAAVAAVRARLAANPRIAGIQEVSAADGDDGYVLTVRASTAEGNPLAMDVQVTPRGVK